MAPFATMGTAPCLRLAMPYRMKENDCGIGGWGGGWQGWVAGVGFGLGFWEESVRGLLLGRVC